MHLRGGESGTLIVFPVLVMKDIIFLVYGEVMKVIMCRKINDTRMYIGSPHSLRVLQSPFNTKEIFTIVCNVYKIVL